MKFAIVGAGGIGCYYAARLIHAGHECVLVARGKHLQALQQHGLQLQHPQFVFDAPVIATDVAGLCQDYACEDFDLLILAAKSSATIPLMEQLQSWVVTAKTPMLSLQNGVTNEKHIAAIMGMERTAGGLAVKIGAHIVAPGKVEATGEAQIDFGAWPSAAANPGLQPLLAVLSPLFTEAGIPNTLYDKVNYALWRKLVINNGVNPLTALTLMDTQAVTSDPVLRHTVHRMMEETARAANIAGVSLTAEDVEQMFSLICRFDAIKTSMQVDREKGRPMEIEDICGPVIQYCREGGQPAETTELIRTLLLRASALDHR
ncbi:ketopantoate reductase family protein [Shewanella yunxiaonensis]|uniref:ketopantoate reductase family protein n=1 Tax=Shewanella yunxiaonensis TaxID=2829809 RepID=UPI001E605DB5|nr:2-dehydropantoate 2-reductase [Shewanella yunxiaonensis]